ncbi:hypothetical protein APPUASWS_031975, partial [Arthrospira platensis str. Paraca]
MTTNADDVWRLLAELAEAQKETERQFQETRQLLQEQSQESDRRFREQSQESDRRFREQSQESDRRFRETERIIKQQNEKLNQELGKLGNRLGEFVEWQVRPAAVQLF